ncbi:sigma-70 family RNA polymerase sigma factor [Streptomyces sp. NBC_00663]|uniref:sigma factor-like helix-turn-helix DNA-binding protein n=1 Tax=Streptomyces sp. NBC_00663 TaxID=2975801 RepID=UPI002E342997|nr:sigma factor-like helix-turn-helix DNA-binding protein [Streptomyces sp. NBC_00663]
MYGIPPGSVDVRVTTAHRSRRVILHALDVSGVSPAVGGRSEGEHASAVVAAVTAQAAFDALYVYAAPSLVQQTYLLTGRRRLAFESTEFAFHQAWEHWPEVACDADPVGWVRERAHEYALAPWHRLRWLVARPDPLPGDAVWQALLALPPRHRRTVVLCDGLGLSVGEAAAEMQASTPATRNRLAHARAALHDRLGDESSNAPQAWIRRRLDQAHAATLAQPWSVRAGSERRTRALTRTVALATAALVALIAFTLATTPGHYEPVERPSTADGRAEPDNRGAHEHECAREASSRSRHLTPAGCVEQTAGQ